MRKKTLEKLSRRERQIMNIIYQNGKATVAEVLEQLPDPPSYSAIRALMRILEEKGFLKHKTDGPRYLYYPTITVKKAKQSALKHVMQTFFDDSTESVVAALLDISASDLTDKDYERLTRLIENARKEGR